MILEITRPLTHTPGSTLVKGPRGREGNEEELKTHENC